MRVTASDRRRLFFNFSRTSETFVEGCVFLTAVITVFSWGNKECSNMMLEHVRSMHLTCLLVFYLCLKIGSQGNNLPLTSFAVYYTEKLVVTVAPAFGPSLGPTGYRLTNFTTYTCYYSRLVPRGTPRVSFTGSNRIHSINWVFFVVESFGDVF